MPDPLRSLLCHAPPSSRSLYILSCGRVLLNTRRSDERRGSWGTRDSDCGGLEPEGLALREGEQFRQMLIAGETSCENGSALAGRVTVAQRRRSPSLYGHDTDARTVNLDIPQKINVNPTSGHSMEVDDSTAREGIKIFVNCGSGLETGGWMEQYSGCYLRTQAVNLPIARASLIPKWCGQTVFTMAPRGQLAMGSLLRQAASPKEDLYQPTKEWALSARMVGRAKRQMEDGRTNITQNEYSRACTTPNSN
ncbi:hypothetical protein C8R45DRAFT_925769 [Mycena sanguinolenta]|nr:hypothetical protein C8R45DRAFT_925769 [Mycena sanguinolenta]